MKKHALLLALVMAACASVQLTPQQNAERSYYTALGSYTEAVQQVVLWANLGQIDAEFAERFEKLRVPARKALNIMKAELAAGNYTAVKTARKVVDALLLEYAAQLKEQNE